jgi:hypothetical protein
MSDSKFPPVALTTVTVKLSVPSIAKSSIAAMSKFADVLPLKIVTVVMPVKSLPSVAVPL